MRRPVLTWCFLLISCLAVPTLHAQGDASDPSDMFLNAYMAAQQGQKLEEDGKWTAALSKYRYAASLLDQVSDRFHDWQPLVVNYRKKKTSDDVARLQQKLAEKAPALPTTPDVEPTLPTQDQSAPNAATPGGDQAGDVVDQATRQIRQQIQELQSQLAQSKAQLSQAQQDKAVMGNRLRDALEKLDRSQISEQEAKSKLAETQDLLKTAVLDNSRNAAAAQQLQAEVARLNSELQTTRDDRDAAEETNEDFQRRLAKASRLTEVVTVQRDAAYEKAKELDGRVATADQRLADLQKQTGASQAEQENLKTALADATERLSTLTQERDNTRASSTAMTEQLDSAKKQIATLGTERQKLIQQRDDARNQLKDSEAAQSRVDQLLADNASLNKKLTEARKALGSGTGGGGEQMLALRQQITETQKDLGEAQQKNEQSQVTISDLQKQLEARTAALASGPGTAAEKAELSQENELLRGIVVREMKEQARREQAKRLVSDELAKLQVQSDTLSQQLDYLGGPVVKLSPAERALFKQPELDLAEAGSASMSLSIAAPKPPAENPPAPPASGMPATDNAPPVETAPKPNVPAELVPTATEGRTAFERGQYRTAENAYEKILSKVPDNLYALSNLGVTRYRAGKYKMAEEALKKAIAIAPNDAFSYRTLGIVYYQQTQYDQAIDTLTKGLAINSKDAVAHSFLGIAASQKGWMEAAQKELETAVTIDPSYGDAHFNLAVVYATQKPPNLEKAQREYNRARELGIAADPQLEQLLKAGASTAASP